MSRTAVLASVLCIGIGVVGAQAAPLNLHLGLPDITSDTIGLNYTSGGGSNNFTASGWAQKMDFDGVAPLDYSITGAGRSYTITATIDSAGVATGGLLTVNGNVTLHAPQPVGTYTSPLLTGTLTQFGYDPSADGNLEFVFSVTGGSLESLYGGQGALVGVVLISANFPGSFASSFTGSGGQSDTAPVPEPATCLFLLAGGVMLAVGRRRNRRAGPLGPSPRDA